MKAIQITHSQELNIVELPQPAQPGEGEVLLRLSYVGFCGSDINTFMGRNTMALNPVIPGHEVGAVIEAVGAGVPETLPTVASVPHVATSASTHVSTTRRWACSAMVL